MAIVANSTALASDFVSTPSGAGDSGKVAKLDSNGKIPTGFLRFGGDGSDGALAISSGTTTISFASAGVMIKNYTSVSITGTAKLAFSNPATNGSGLFMRSQGAVTLTSSQAPMIDLSGMGAAPNNDGYGPALVKTNTGLSNVIATGGISAAAGTFNPGTALLSYLMGSKYPMIAPGAGGGSAAGSGCGGASGGGSVVSASSAGVNGNNNNGTSATAGRGGGWLVIECAGAFNFTTASGISVNGLVGGNGATGNAGGSGGGGAGIAIILYNFLTAASGTITSTGGAGGTLLGTGGNGGAGANGYSTMGLNTEFA